MALKHRAVNSNKKRTPTYHTWNAMIQRCLNPLHKNYDNYGGRGIGVDPYWIGNFKNFLKDMGERPEGLSLDRIDCNKSYCKENCRWATSSEQRMNQRRMKPILAEHTEVLDKHDKLCEELGINI